MKQGKPFSILSALAAIGAQGLRDLSHGSQLWSAYRVPSHSGSSKKGSKKLRGKRAYSKNRRKG